MTWKKRLLVGLRLALLMIYLDGAFLIYIRSVDGNGIYQTAKMKWLSLLLWSLCCIFLWLVQEIISFILKMRTYKRGEDLR